MRSTNQPLCDLFERQRRYVVPLFQRAYVWNEEEQWQPLWQDIADRATAVLSSREGGSRARVGNHFLGAVVFNQIKVYGRQVDTVEVIDGQQRLTTLQLLLAAFRDAIATTDEKRLQEDLDRLTENGGVREEELERFKVWPTNADRRDFEAAMSARSPDMLEERYPLRRRKYARKPDPRPRLIEAYLYFGQSIRTYCWDRLGDDETGVDWTFHEDRAYALFEALRRHIQLVVIELEEDDDPQVIFETLNARGVPLLPSDLIRNFVFLRATQQGHNADDLYMRLWHDYDERPAEEGAGGEARFWKQTERQGRLKRTRLDLFVFHYLQYQTGQELGIGHLYQAFRTWWESEVDRDVESGLEELRRHSDAFGELFVPAGDSRRDVFATRLRAIDTSTVYPALLMLLVGGQGKLVEADLDGIVTDLESFLVRRMVCALSTKNYNRFFFGLLKRMRAEPVINRDLVQSYLLAGTGTATEWPSDEAFLTSWLRQPSYQNLKAAKCSMVLEAIDRQMQSHLQEPVTIAGRLTVEHVMPQSWETAWEAPPALPVDDPQAENAEERRNRMLHTFGNLTLLTQALNSTVSNGPYEAKRVAIAQQSALRLNAYLQDRPTWAEAEIEERGRTLFEVAKRIWPRPETRRL